MTKKLSRAVNFDQSQLFGITLATSCRDKQYSLHPRSEWKWAPRVGTKPKPLSTQNFLICSSSIKSHSQKSSVRLSAEANFLKTSLLFLLYFYFSPQFPQSMSWSLKRISIYFLSGFNFLRVIYTVVMENQMRFKWKTINYRLKCNRVILIMRINYVDGTYQWGCCSSSHM